MALRTNASDISVRIDPISFSAGISVLGGNTTQVGNGLPDGYMPSRQPIHSPCYLLPVVEVADPEQFYNGRQELVNCFWYEGVPQKDDSNLITASTPNYKIDSEDGVNKFMLTVYKNFPINTAQIIHARFSIMDKRTDTLIWIERQIVFKTFEYSTDMFHVQLTDCPAIMRVDPLDEADCGEAPWLHTVSAQLYNGLDAIDEKAHYKWQIFDNARSSYRDFTADEKALLVKNVDTKSLTFDARFFATAGFKCNVTIDGKKMDYPLYTNVSVVVKLNESADARIFCSKGLRIGAFMDEEVAYECSISTNRGKLPDDKYGLFRIVWKAKDDRVGAVEKILGEGKRISFVPKKYGFTCNHYAGVYADVYLRSHSAAVTDESNRILTTESGKAIITNQYK